MGTYLESTSAAARILFFGQDVLIGFAYVSFFVAYRKGREKLLRPTFLIPLALFAWLAAAQIFNPNSPSILYGLLGFKLYFYYVPLLFLGYALIRNEEDLRKFLVVNASLAGIISALGVAQTILGNNFQIRLIWLRSYRIWAIFTKKVR